jgi:hypothetical protein
VDTLAVHPTKNRANSNEHARRTDKVLLTPKQLLTLVGMTRQQRTVCVQPPTEETGPHLYSVLIHPDDLAHAAQFLPQTCGYWLLNIRIRSSRLRVRSHGGNGCQLPGRTSACLPCFPVSGNCLAGAGASDHKPRARPSGVDSAALRRTEVGGQLCQPVYCGAGLFKVGLPDFSTADACPCHQCVIAVSQLCRRRHQLVTAPANHRPGPRLSRFPATVAPIRHFSHNKSRCHAAERIPPVSAPSLIQTQYTTLGRSRETARKPTMCEATNVNDVSSARALVNSLVQQINKRFPAAPQLRAACWLVEGNQSQCQHSYSIGDRCQ